MAIRIPIYAVSPKRILKAIQNISKAQYSKNAQLVKAKIRATDGVKKSVELMNNFVLNARN